MLERAAWAFRLSLGLHVASRALIPRDAALVGWPLGASVVLLLPVALFPSRLAGDGSNAAQRSEVS